jgi:hypothetical protein
MGNAIMNRAVVTKESIKTEQGEEDSFWKSPRLHGK